MHRRRRCAFLRGKSRPDELHHVGHSPLGAWSVLALLGLLVVQVATGLVADDEIASNGPLVRFVSGASSNAATHWHRRYGQWLVIALLLLHVAAIVFYALTRKHRLVGPMLHGDKRLVLTANVPASIDTAASRLFALAIAVVCGLGVALIARLGD